MSRRSLQHFPALDGLRGVAIALVLALHSGYGPHFLGGGLGVDVFFVLSGFLITSLLLSEHERTGHITLSHFYLRRALRLYPALVTMVIGALALHNDLPSHSWAAAGTASVAVLFYVANLVTAFSHNGRAIDGLAHTWNLAMEEQFYIVWPAVLMLCLRLRRTWVTPVLLVLAALISFISLRHNGPGVDGVPQAYFRPEARDFGLLCGCATALFHDNRRQIPRWMPTGCGWVGAAILVFAVVSAGRTGIGYLPWDVPLASAGTGLLIYGLLRSDTHPISAFLAWIPLRGLGLISYGAYLYSGLFNAVTATHIADWSAPAQALLRTGGAILLAIVSYFALEQPIRRRGRSWLAQREPEGAVLPPADSASSSPRSGSA